MNMFSFSPFSPSPSPPATSYSSAPMDIPSASKARPVSPSCAFPSWPRRSSLSSDCSDDEAPASAFIDDDDLLFPAVFDDSERDCTPLATPHANRSPTSFSMMHEAQVVVDTGALMRELIAQEKAARKEKKRRGSRSGSRKSRSGSSNKPMSPILEAGE